MLKVFATQVVISRGYDNKPAISITKGNDSAASVRFRIGKKVYDPKAENNARWLNYSVKGFGPIVDRIEKMARSSISKAGWTRTHGRIRPPTKRRVVQLSFSMRLSTLPVVESPTTTATRRTAQAIRHLLKLLQLIPAIAAVVSPALNLLAAIRSLMIRIKEANK